MSTPRRSMTRRSYVAAVQSAKPAEPITPRLSAMNLIAASEPVSPRTKTKPTLSGTARLIENGLRIHHYKPYRPGLPTAVRGLVVLAPGSRGGMGPGQTADFPHLGLFSPEIDSIYTEVARSLAEDHGMGVAHLTWRTPPTRAGASPALRKMPAMLREAANDVAAAARFLRVAHESQPGAATLPLVLIGYCFGAAAVMAAASRALHAEAGFALEPLAGVACLAISPRIDGTKHQYGGHDTVSAANTLGAHGIPLLMLHGSTDDVCDASCSQLLFEGAPGPKSLLILHGSAHNLVHRAAEAVSLLKDAWVPTLVRRWGVIGALDPSQTEAPAECCEGIAFGKALMV